MRSSSAGPAPIVVPEALTAEYRAPRPACLRVCVSRKPGTRTARAGGVVRHTVPLSSPRPPRRSPPSTPVCPNAGHSRQHLVFTVADIDHHASPRGAGLEHDHDAGKPIPVPRVYAASMSSTRGSPAARSRMRSNSAARGRSPEAGRQPATGALHPAYDRERFFTARLMRAQRSVASHSQVPPPPPWATSGHLWLVATRPGLLMSSTSRQVSRATAVFGG